MFVGLVSGPHPRFKPFTRRTALGVKGKPRGKPKRLIDTAVVCIIAGFSGNLSVIAGNMVLFYQAGFRKWKVRNGPALLS